jgi:hypothetical protein
MTFDLYSDVALRRDLPEHGLRRGDVIRLVGHHLAPDGREGYSAEVLSASGHTLAVIVVDATALEVLHDDEIFSVRSCPLPAPIIAK